MLTRVQSEEEKQTALCSAYDHIVKSRNQATLITRATTMGEPSYISLCQLTCLILLCKFSYFAATCQCYRLQNIDNSTTAYSVVLV